MVRVIPLLLLWTLSQTPAQELRAAEPPDWEAVVRRLASTNYQERQEATAQLWAAGPVAVPWLERAAGDANLEVRRRASYVLENVRQGIDHNLSRWVLREVQRFREGELDERRFALNTLENAGRPRVLWGLIQTETDERARQEFLYNFERALQKAILAGALPEVEVALRTAATSDVWIRHWVAFQAARGVLAQDREAFVADSHSEVVRARRTLYLLRAVGDQAGAARAAVEVVDQSRAARPGDAENAGETAEEMPWELAIERRDWREAARWLRHKMQQDPEGAGKDPERMGLLAACYERAGDAAAAVPIFESLVRLAEAAERELPEIDPRRTDVAQKLKDRQWLAGKALLLNGRFGDAAQVLRPHHPAFAFEVLAYQRSYREAFALAGVTYPNGFDQSWFEKLAASRDPVDDGSRQQFAIGMHALRQLYFLGQRDQVLTWLRLVGRSVLQEPGTARRRMLTDTAVRLGQRELAREVGATVLEREGNLGVLAVLYPQRAATAGMWWEFFRETKAQEPFAESLARIDRCLLLAQPPLSGPERSALALEAETLAAKQPDTKKVEWWRALAETWQAHGDRELARRNAEKAATLSSGEALRMGDWWATEQSWERAATYYQQASEFDPLKALPQYLWGAMLVRQGKTSDGEQRMQMARLLPLGNDGARREFAAGLKERGYGDEARRQFELLLTTGAVGEQDVVEASKQLGNLTYSREPLQGAECWDWLVLCCLKKKWGFVDAAGYVQIPFLVHKTQARGWLMAGEWESAAVAIQRAETVAPFNLELPEELIPELDKAGRQEDSRRLLVRSTSRLREQIADFPDCALLRNNLAWLLARVAPDLSDALDQARAAVRLEPHNPAYLDTLGEVHFRRRDWKAALECAEQCCRLDPQSRHYAEQLLRFRQAAAAAGQGTGSSAPREDLQRE